MSAPTPAQILTRMVQDMALRAYEDELADGLISEPEVEPDWNDPIPPQEEEA